MKIVKKLTHGKNRAATRNELHHRRYDNIPVKDFVKEEDPWAWD